MSKIKMTVKDLVFIGVMSTLSLVLSFVVGIATMPAMVFSVIASGGLSAMVMALPFFLMAYKVNKRGLFAVYTVVQGLLYLFMGFHIMLIVVVPLGFICEVIMWKKESYRSFKKNTLTWTIYGTIYALHGFIFLKVLGLEAFKDTMAEMATGDMVDFIVHTFSSIRGVIAIGALGGLGGFLGSISSWIILKKHFIKAGVINLK